MIYAKWFWTGPDMANIKTFCHGLNVLCMFWTGPNDPANIKNPFSQFCLSVVSNSLQPHKPQHARPPCPSPTPGVHPNPCPLSRWCHPTISSSVAPFSSSNLSQHQGLFKWVTSSHQVAKVLESQPQHQSSNEYSGLISFRRDGLDLLAVQGTLKSLLQHHSSKASILQCSAIFIVQLDIRTWLLEKP